MNLIIVESPTKSKTIQGFLGKNYLVEPSYGHIRDLPKKELGVNIENDFKPKYVVPPKAKKRVEELKNKVARSKETILGVDEDREGESIAWHLSEVLGLKNPKRIVFHEITKQAVEEALKNPRGIDMKLVNAQQARRILDRLVGYKLSPFLWKKVKRGLSAGRVQSVAVRLVVEREREIEKFVPQEFWTIEAALTKIRNPKSKTQNSKLQTGFNALLIKKDGKPIDRLEINNKAEAEKIINDLEGAEYTVESIEKKEIKKNPLPPFTTSTLQQEAWNRFKFSAKKTMALAQSLYETGLITYHRTDSLNLSTTSQAVAKKFIEENYGKKYWPGFTRNFKTKTKTAQEAHEAIRPTYPEKTAEVIKTKDEQHRKLYDLIWRRFVASQMSQAFFYGSQIDIAAKNYTFRATGQILKFDGFLRVYPMKFEENELPELEKNEILELKKLNHFRHFTHPPARYSEATLIKVLEKEGIGRPSTYAPILDTVQKRNYVEKDENKKLKPTKIGFIVNDLLVEHFPEIVDLKFTAKMENRLDEIAEGKKNWVKILRDFYTPFEKNLTKKEKEVKKQDLTEKTDKTCPRCGAPLVIRLGKFGRFYACSKFPNCKHTENLPKPSLNIKCPQCQQGEIVEKFTKKRTVFYGCSLWPLCNFALWEKPTGETCAKCGALITQTKQKKIKCSNKECSAKKSQ